MLMARAIAAKSLFGTTYYPGKDLKNLQWVPEPIDAVAGESFQTCPTGVAERASLLTSKQITQLLAIETPWDTW